MATDSESKPERPCFIIFGGSGGIGSALARRLKEDAPEADIVITGRDRSHLERVGQELQVRTTVLDISEPGSIDRCVSAVVENGSVLSGVVNCIGSVHLKPAHLTSDEDWDSVISLNLTTAFRVVRAAASAMMRSGGSIVLVSSAAAIAGIPSHEAIAAAKAGVIGLCRSAAASYARRGIRVNCIAPGMVQTEMTRPIWSSEVNRHASEKMHALGRLGAPEDIAAAAAFLLSAQSSWVSGEVLSVDGGLAWLRTKS
ncbi:SDR family oxidoreductase [bacterium]|nr:SDR family oxidoreductase [bacterium]